MNLKTLTSLGLKYIQKAVSCQCILTANMNMLLK